MGRLRMEQKMEQNGISKICIEQSPCCTVLAPYRHWTLFFFWRKWITEEQEGECNLVPYLHNPSCPAGYYIEYDYIQTEQNEYDYSKTILYVWQNIAMHSQDRIKIFCLDVDFEHLTSLGNEVMRVTPWSQHSFPLSMYGGKELSTVLVRELESFGAAYH